MKKIERPDWLNFVIQRNDEKDIFTGDLNKWFDTHVEPINKLLEGAVEVYSTEEEEFHACGVLYKPSRWYDFDKPLKTQTHRAYLIGIELIKKETAEDVLRDVMQSKYVTDEEWKQFKFRAKAVLGDNHD